MGSQNVSKARLLFVLSNDYGELSNAMYLTMGCSFQVMLLMPDRLFAVNANTLGARTGRYGSIQDVIDAVDRERPDIVFLFSGYLYAINNLLGIEAVEALVRSLRGRGQRLVTSDPFLGILAELDLSTFSDKHPRQGWLVDHFGRLFRLLRDIPHLYLVRADEFARTPSASFFNPRLLIRPSTLAAFSQKLVDQVRIDPGRRQWVFVMSLEDYGGQVARFGQGRYDDLLIYLLQDTVRAGRQPVLIAPQECITSIRSTAPGIDGLIRLPFCGFEVFRRLLLGGEYVFYWNIFSNTIPARVVNHLPVFFFDPGHMVHAIPPLFERGMRRYYCGAELPYVDQCGGLISEALATLAAHQDDALQAAREKFRQSPTPEEMVASLLQS
jgi:hypothetical protein